MKKILLVVGISIFAVLAFGVVGYAYAQNQTPPASEYPYGPGMMGNYDDNSRGYGRGMMGGRDGGMMGGYGMMSGNGEYGPMHESMVAALAEALVLTPEEVEARHDAGETMWQIAEAAGLNSEEIQNLMLSAHDLALEDAVANGGLTEEQAEGMDTHMEQMWSGDYQNGSFGSHCGAGWGK